MRYRLLVMACAMAIVPAAVATGQARRGAVDLGAQADARAAIGDFRGAGAIAADAVARVEARGGEPLHAALVRLAGVQSQYDTPAMLITLARISALAGALFGADDFRTVHARYEQAHWGNAFGRATTPDQVAVLADRLAVLARTTSQRIESALALAVAADQYGLRGDAARAMPLVARATALADSLPPAESPTVGETYLALATMMGRYDRLTDAIALADKAVAAFEAAGGVDYRSIPLALGVGAQAAGRAGDYARAETYLRRSNAIIDAKPGLAPEIRVRGAMDYGQLHAALRRWDLAFPLIEKAVEISAELPPGFPLNQGVALAAGRSYLTAGRPDDALRHLRRGLALTETGAPNRTQGLLLTEIAGALLRQGDAEGASAHVGRALAVLEPLVPPGDLSVATAQTLIGDIAVRRGDHAAAAVSYARAEAGFRGLAPLSRILAGTRIKLATAQSRAGTLDGAGWHVARLGADAITVDLGRAMVVGNERVGSDDAVIYFGDAIAVAWAYQHPPR